MAGVTDRAFRALCIRYGAGLTFSEMVSAKGLEYNGVKTFALTDPAEAPPLGLMIFLVAVPGVIIIGVLLALWQRIKQIQGGEEDAASKY